MQKLVVNPGVTEGVIKAPPSKSYTHRALALALLSNGESEVINPLISGDTSATIEACREFGAYIVERRESVVLKGKDILDVPENVIDAKNSGTTLRIFTAISSLTAKGYTVLTGSRSLRKRPMAPLINSLNHLGVNAWTTKMNGYPPVIVEGGGIKGGKTGIRGDISSQFITALILASTKAKGDVEINVQGQMVSEPYIDMTIHMLREFNGELKRNGKKIFIPGDQELKGAKVEIPGDFSSASFILAAAALTRSKVKVKGLNFDFPQADMKIPGYLKEMGQKIRVNKENGWIEIQGCELQPGYFNLKETPDLLPVLAVLASKAKGKTVLEGVKHTRYKESNRLLCIAKELLKLGVKVQVEEDRLTVEGRGGLKGGLFESHGDHRLFMAFTVLALSLKTRSIINGPFTHRDSYPDFLTDLIKLKADLKEIVD